MSYLSRFQSSFTKSVPAGPARQQTLSERLSCHIPYPAVSAAVDWFLNHPVELVIAAGRRSKAGDFRPPRNHVPATITVNGTLNPYSFLITLVHEMAHFHADHEKRPGIPMIRKKNKPHGPLWKEHFRNCMAIYLRGNIFPEDLLSALFRHLENPAASVARDSRLSRMLAGYDRPSGLVAVEELPEGTFFSVPGGNRFQKQEKMRKRYRCPCITNGKTYLFSPVAMVFPEY